MLSKHIPPMKNNCILSYMHKRSGGIIWCENNLFLYIENHALQFITKQEKLNQRHVKWIEYMHNFTFVVKHINGQTNKVVDSLSRRCLICKNVKSLCWDLFISSKCTRRIHISKIFMKHVRIQLAGIEVLGQSTCCRKDCCLKETSYAFPNVPWGTICCRKSMVEDYMVTLGKSTYAQLSSFYYWPGMREDVKKYVEKWKVC